MGFLKKLSGRMAGGRQTGGKRSSVAIPVGVGLAAIALLLNLGLTSFTVQGYLQQDGFAVPQNTLSAFVRNADASGKVSLVPVNVGDAIYVRVIGSRDYFIGEDKRPISSSYPVYTRDGLVLYFLDGNQRMITEDWQTLTTYDGLYLSDGVTFNADNTQADLERILLVRTDGGYILAQQAEVTSALRSVSIPMNAVCGFFETEIVFYSYQDGAMTGSAVRMAESATIKINGVTYGYRDFLERLGLWEMPPVEIPPVEIPLEETPPVETPPVETPPVETPPVETPPVETPPVETPPVETPPVETPPAATPSPVPTPAAPTPPIEPPAPSESTPPEEVSGEEEARPMQPQPAAPARPTSPAQPVPGELSPTSRPAEPGKDVNPRPPVGGTEQPSGPIENPDNTPQSPVVPDKPPVANPDFVKPEVSFGDLSAWVYTLSTEASIYDPASVLRSGGVQLYVYQVEENGREVSALRQTVSASGSVLLGQVRPSTKFHVKAEFSYRDENNILRNESIDLGYVTTDGFDTLEPIKYELRDETVQGINLTPVEVFSRALQARDIRFTNISNGISVEVTDNTSTASNAGLNRAEGYVNVLTLHAVAEGSSSTTELRMDSQALRLLCSGYTLSHWESPEQLKSGTEYTYTVSMTDRYGNKFSIDPVNRVYSGHTCKAKPSVTIRVPDDTNRTNSTQLNITWQNPDDAEVRADARSGMGDNIVAGLYLFRTDSGSSQPIELKAYRVNSSGKPVNQDGEEVTEADAAVTGRYLPIDTTRKGGVTSWVVKDLEPFAGYTAVVKCGIFAIDDNKVHLGEDLDSTCQFLTVTLRSRVSYTAEVDEITSDDARLKFRMNPTDDVLIPLINQVNFTLQRRVSGVTDGGFSLLKDDLEEIEIQPSGTAFKAVLYADGTRVETEMTLIYPGLPMLPNGKAPQNVWEFLLATSTTGNSEGCWVTVHLGGLIDPVKQDGSSKLFALAPATQYMGRFTSSAKLGGVQVDVTSSSSQSVIFRTFSEEATVRIKDVFVSDSFIELYGLQIEDPGESILADVENRGGNVAVRIYEYNRGATLNPVGNQVTNRYIDKGYTEDDQGPLRISGLSKDKEYVMIFQAQRYNNGVDAVPLQNRALRYAELDSSIGSDENPTWLIFKTGNTVTGDLSLIGVTQQYWGGDDGNQLTTSLSVLTEDDFYTGVWQDNSNLYYVDYKLVTNEEGAETKVGNEEEWLKKYKETLEKKETDLTKAYLDQQKALTETYNSTTSPLTARFYNVNWDPENIWTSRFIQVKPGQQYSIYGGYSSSSPRITFFWDNGDGQLRYYSQYSIEAYVRGGVFKVPAPSNNNDATCYMRISGTSLQMRSGMVVEQYEPDRTTRLKQPNLGEGAEIVQGLYLGSSNNLTNSATRAYVSDYIGGITGGSVYEIKSRDPNKPDSAALLGNDTTCDYVFFYDSSYTFLGSYYVSNQTALVKAPFGAAYCRFNLQTRRENPEDETTSYIPPSWTGEDNKWDPVSIKLYKAAAANSYSVNFRLLLEDKTDEQMMRGGQYEVEIYETVSPVSDAADLTAVTAWEKKDSGMPAWTIERTGEATEHLFINRILTSQNLSPNRGIKAVLRVKPWNWDSWVTLDTVYFTTNRVVTSISSLEGLLSIRSNPAGSYVVTNDLVVNQRVLDNDRPFTGVIDFQGHKVTIENTTPLFRRISAGGVVKNAEVVYNAVGADNATSAIGSQAPVAENNYGTIQNVVVRFNPQNPAYPALEMYYSGGICINNYGTIDGFIVEFQKDVYVNNYFGGICLNNYGHIANGYVTGVPYLDPVRRETRPCTLIHRYKYAGVAVGTSAYYISLGVGYNAARGSIESVFVVGDLIIESEKGESSPEEIKNDKNEVVKPADSSVSNTHTAGILVGNNNGSVERAYVSGDRWDYGEDGKRDIMTDRGPAVSNVGGMYHVEDVSYFSSREYTTSPKRDSIGSYNSLAQPESLYEYQWHEFRLGKDGERFIIRDMIEKNEGYYPQLILPECFKENNGDFIQREIALDLRSASKSVEVLFNEVRVQGVDKALVTVSIANRQNKVVTGFGIYDGISTAPMRCEVLAQGAVGSTYQVDILLSLTANESGAIQQDSLDSYIIENVTFANETPYNAFDKNGERTVHAVFWKTINSVAEYRMYIADNKTSGGISGNYLLTADLDFSGSTSYSDWYYGNGEFRGVLNGGIYAIKNVVLTDYLGQPLRDETGAAREIGVWGTLMGMHTISGVGNADKAGEYAAGRRGGEYTNSLFRYLRGTLENIVFEDFRSVNNSGTNEANAYYSGVVAVAYPGAKIDNCHVRNSNFFGRARLGALVGHAEGATISNCSAGNTVLETVRRNQGTDSISAGGLVGFATSGCTVENCFASGVNITATDVYNSDGIGGLIGYATNNIIQSCYTAGGTIDLRGISDRTSGLDVGSGRAGGIVGQLAGESTMTGCWSMTTVMTASDYAGGLVGYHSGGVLANNYTASTLITRSLAASSVHRVCNNVNFHESNRHDNYAFAGQYLTYTDKSREGTEESIYQFGIWGELDGATRLLSADDLKSAGTWANQIGVNPDCFDLNGTAQGVVGFSGELSSEVSEKSRPFSEGTRVGGEWNGVSKGVMPKLRHSETGFLLCGQGDVQIGFESSSVLSRVRINQDHGRESFTVTLALFSLREDLKSQMGSITNDNKELLADWDKMVVVGGRVSGEVEMVAGIMEDESLPGGKGQVFTFTVDYGDAMDADNKPIIGHYLDSYILSLPIYTENPYRGTDGAFDPTTPTEIVQVRLALTGTTGQTEPIYKEISSMTQWNEFFDPASGHAAYFENIRLSSDLVFTMDANGVTTDQINVKVNRLTGANNTTKITSQRSDDPDQTRLPIKMTAKAGLSLISQVATELSNLTFENIGVTSTDFELKEGKLVYKKVENGYASATWQGGDNKGIISLLQGDIRNVAFQNVTVDGGSSGSVGLIGRMYGTADGVTLDSINVVSNGSYVGGLVGYAEGYTTIKNVTLGGGNTTERSTVRSLVGEQVGGIAGRLEGLAENLNVSNTDVYGRHMVGGLAGSTYTDGNRPDLNKLQNCAVGAASKTKAINTRDPGVLVNEGELVPDVTVTLEATRETGSGVQYVGGAVGYGDGRKLRGIEVYNTQVSVEPRGGKVTNGEKAWTMTAAGVREGTYNHNAGGVVGGGSGSAQECLADNCTVSTYGQRAGGISGDWVGYYNLARDCAIYSVHENGGAVGGVTGYNGATRCVAEHCVVSGANSVGGYTGDISASYCYQGGVVDCVVLGVNRVGGVAGLYRGYALRSFHVTTSEKPVEITLRENMLAPAMKAYAGKQYSGAYVEGTEGVGGVAGEMCGVSIYDCYVNAGTKIKGEDNVGGLVGTFYGWHRDYWNTTRRSLYNCAMGADVEGSSYVSAAIGYYTQWDKDRDGPETETKATYRDFDHWKKSQTDKTWTTVESPYRDNFRGLLITGNVKGNSNVGVLLGGGQTQPSGWDKESLWPDGATWDDVAGERFFYYCRIWEGSRITEGSTDVMQARALQSFNTVSEIPLNTAQEKDEDGNPLYGGETNDVRRTKGFQRLLTVTGDNLTDFNLYFGGRNNTYGGLGWDRTNWDMDPIQRMYEPGKTTTDPDAADAPASFEAYKKGLGVVNEGGSISTDLVLWLDGRNNTGEGYTDENSEKWVDLSANPGMGNDAALYWNNKNSKSEVSMTVGERASVMRWNDGALEFYTGSTAYYAQLEQSLSETLNKCTDGFTVELIYSYVSPRNTNHNSILSWRTAASGGGFHGYHSPTGTYGNGLLHYDVGQSYAPAITAPENTSETNNALRKQEAERFIRSSAYVYSVNADGTKKLDYYMNGNNLGSSTVTESKPLVFIQDQNENWRIGYGNYTNEYLRVCGVRVYTRALSKDELKNNANYNMWYYFGGEKPEGAETVDASKLTIELKEDGRVIGGTGPYTLIRSDNGGYNGTLAMRNYDGQGLGSRGYYYVKDSDGNYSNIVAKTDSAYGPRLRNIDLGNEYYGVVKYNYVLGQEGENSETGLLYNTDDNMFYGGFRLPDFGLNRRGENIPTATGTSLMSLRRVNGIPEVEAYASGADTVNLELSGYASEGLTYAIFSEEYPAQDAEPVLSGRWPADSRTLTMTWDYQTPFNLRLTLGEEETEFAWSYADLGRTVMLYGEKYWYLYGSQCYTGGYDGVQSLVTEDGSVVFLHMMDGQLLDEGKNLWDAGTGTMVGPARAPFQLLETPTALWSGTVDSFTVNSYGTYLTSTGSEGVIVREAALVIRDGNPYILQNVQPNNFLVGKINAEDSVLTVLKRDGTLYNGGQPLVCPDTFRNTGIRELANNQRYTGYKPVALVRYEDGSLVAFDYVTGEAINVVSPEAALSLLDFVTQSISASGLRSLIVGTESGSALKGMTYEKEVAKSATLRTALANLKGNTMSSAATDGTGAGVYGAGVPGGQDGEAGSGLDGENGLEGVINEGQSVVSGAGVVVEGPGNAGGEYTGADGEYTGEGGEYTGEGGEYTGEGGEPNPAGRPVVDTKPGLVDQPIVDTQPDPVDQPVVDTQPDPADQPAVGTQPGPVDQPVVGTQPDPANQPVVDAQPDPMDQPIVDTKPGPVDQPIVDTQPDPVDQPVVDTQPDPADQPVVGTQPDPADQPAVGTQPDPADRPVVGTQPDPANQPVVDTQPSPANQPVVDAEPSPADRPVVDAKPGPANQPIVDTQPSPADRPVVGTQPGPANQPIVDTQPDPANQPIVDTQPDPANQPVVGTQPDPANQPIVDTQPDPADQPVVDTQPNPANQPVVDAQPDPAEQPVTDAKPDPAGPEGEAFSGANRYVTVYGLNGGDSAVYDLQEFLSQPEEQLVSQEERAEELARLGIHTTLASSGQPPKESASGLALMYVVAGVIVVMLICMTVLKKRKLDDKD